MINFLRRIIQNITTMLLLDVVNIARQVWRIIFGKMVQVGNDQENAQLKKKDSN